MVSSDSHSSLSLSQRGCSEFTSSRRQYEFISRCERPRRGKEPLQGSILVGFLSYGMRM